MFYYSKPIFRRLKRRSSPDKPTRASSPTKRPEVTSAVIVAAISKDLKAGVIPKVSSRLLQKMKVADLKKMAKLANERKVLAKFKTPRLKKKIYAFEFKMHKRVILKTMTQGKLPTLGIFLLKLSQKQLDDLRNAIMSGAMSMKRKLDQSRRAKTPEGKKLYKKFLYLLKTVDDQKFALAARQDA